MAYSSLPDTFLLNLFESLSAEDRLSCSQVCSNWFNRVREVNQAVRCLTISSDVEDYRTLDFLFPCRFINPHINQQLMKIGQSEGQENVHQEKLQLCTKWNTLHFSLNKDVFCETSGTTRERPGLQLNSTIVQQIMSAFPAVTELNFYNNLSSPQYEHLVQMLECDKGWGHQLTTLRIKEKGVEKNPTSERLISAINRLPALTRLAMNIAKFEGFTLLELPVFCRLKEIRFQGDVIPLLRSVQRYAADNAHLRIDLPEASLLLENLLEPTNAEATLLDDYIRKRIVRVNTYYSIWNHRLVCTSFPNLTSLAVFFSNILNIEWETVFALISTHLSYLSHLHLNIYLGYSKVMFKGTSNDFENGQITIPRPISPMISIKLLELNVTIVSHTDLEWLNLPVTMPNLAHIYFSAYHCEKCDIDSYAVTDSPEDIAFRQCLRTVLPQLSHSTGLSLEQISVRVRSGNILTAKELLAE